MSAVLASQARLKVCEQLCQRCVTSRRSIPSEHIDAAQCWSVGLRCGLVFHCHRATRSCMRRVWVLPWCLVVHFERFAALWVRVVSRRLVCEVHTRDLNVCRGSRHTLT